MLLGKIDDRVIHDHQQLRVLDRFHGGHPPFACMLTVEECHLSDEFVRIDISEQLLLFAILVEDLQPSRFHDIHRRGVVSLHEKKGIRPDEAILAVQGKLFPFGFGKGIEK